MNAASVLGFDSFIVPTINIFPEHIQQLLAVYKNGDILKAKDIQEKLTSAVIAIMKHGKYIFHLIKCRLIVIKKSIICR